VTLTTDNSSAIIETVPVLTAHVDISQRIQVAIAKAKSTQSSLTIIYIDLDRYTAVSSALGNNTGNALIKTVHQRLHAAVDKRFQYFHFGADKFIVLREAPYSAPEIRQFASRLLNIIKKPIFVDEQQLVSTASIGVSSYPQKASNGEELLEQSLSATKDAKEMGGDCIKFFTRVNSSAASIRKLNLEVELRNAIDRKDLTVHYQPKMDLATGNITALEALVRWYHDDLGCVKPSEFIPIAENAGLISELGTLVLETACRHGVSWINEGINNTKIAVNLSAKQLIRNDMLGVIKRILKKTNFPPQNLVIELTESLVFDDMRKTPALLKSLRSMGIEIAIDDFGTGYSTFKLLKQLPVDILKIDQMFIQDIINNPADLAITKAIIDVAHALNIRVIAEGVENSEHVELLKELGCDSIQGFYLSQALPRNQISKILRVGVADKDPIPRNEELFAY